MKVKHFEHVLRSIRHKRFRRKRVIDLAPSEVELLFTQWVPVIKREWGKASVQQRLDCVAIESAFFVECGRPWER